MNTTSPQLFTRSIGCERAMIMLPFNVVLAARIRGALQPSKLTTALERLRQRHPFIGLRVVMEENGTASFVSDNVPEITSLVEERKSDEQWITKVKHELRTSFTMTTGPLVRCNLLYSPDVSDIILCAHHAICDGMSLSYLLRDLLQLLTGSDRKTFEPLIPPPVDASNVPTPPTTRPLMRLIMSMINKKWASKKISFTEAEMRTMHNKFWEQNGTPEVMAWSLGREATAALIKRCRVEKVTVNSALWTAFLAAQNEVQKDHFPFRNRSAMAVNTRDKLLNPAGESFGFFASSLTVRLGYSPKKQFWENARRVHAKINRELDRTNLFRMLVSDEIHPTLLDALYFQKYGMLNESIAAKFLKKMGWHKVTYGCALTNVGRLDIPVCYGPLKIETVHGPLFFSDVEEKMIGMITVGGKLSFLMGCGEAMSRAAKQIKEEAMSNLEKAVSRTV